MLFVSCRPGRQEAVVSCVRLLGGQDPCHSKHWVRGVCIFGVADLPQLTQRHELFVNKFHQDYQPLAMDCMEEWLYNRSYQHPEFDYSYYKNLPFIIP